MTEFTCGECSKVFSTGEALKQHKDAKHYAAPPKKAFDASGFLLRNWKLVLAVIVLLAFAFIVVKAVQSPINTRLGTVGSEHSHADFKVYVNGLPLDFSKPKYDGSRTGNHYVHMHSGNAGGSSLIHKHANGATFQFFLNSLGFKADKTCLTTDEARQYCAAGNSTLKFFVNGKQLEDVESHEIRDGDKLLLSFGSDDAKQLEAELSSLTDFSAQARAGLIGG